MTNRNPNTQPASIQWLPVLGQDYLGLDSVEQQQLSDAILRHSPRSVRLSSRRDPRELPFATVRIPWNSRGYWLTDPQVRPGAFLQFAAGDYYIQDASSMLALTLCNLSPGDIVCDLCAAPGGKATGLLDQLQGNGFLLANEVIQSRLALLQSALCRSGWSNHATSNLDADQLAERLPSSFDCVLVDAPCSGQSMVGREKQSSSAFTESQIQHSAARQRRIIRSAAKLVRPGGRLIYSTCTFAIAENEAIIEDFLAEDSDWSMAPAPELDAWTSPRLPGSYRLWPHRDRCDGGFAAAIQKNAQAEVSPLPVMQRSSRQQTRSRQSSVSLKDLEFLSIDENVASTFETIPIGSELHLLQQCTLPNIAQHIHAGVPVAHLHSSRIEPLYGSSVVDFSTVRPAICVSLNHAQAIAFVRGESVHLPENVNASGWCQVCWNDRPLAWGKITGSTLKNHLPKLLRNPSIALA